ncbi:hypothetical protein LTS08_004748 [Lithohypha guttulata]|nr:hypothetical protein LTS08_004748 [Lithohypha guttulata]
MSLKYTRKLEGKRVLVLGGTSGIGFCVAENALENGAHVIVASSRQPSIDSTLSRLRNSYPELSSNVTGHTIDLRSSESEASIIELLKAATNDGTEPCDHIVHTAGDNLSIGPIDQFEGAEALLNAQRVRLLAPMLFAKHAPGKYMRRSNTSSIIFTGGVNTYRPGAGWAIPALVGGAQQGLMRALAVDLKPIRVNLVEPGAIDTELFQRTFTGEQLEAFRQKYRDQTLTGAIGTPENMSEAYLYVMRDAFVTGQTVLSEGGLLLAPGAQR